MKLVKALNVLEADRRLILTLGSLHFLVAAAHSFFDIGATALLIIHLGPDTLPQVYLGSAVLLIFVGLVIIPLIDRLDRTRLFRAILVIFAAVLLLSTPFSSRAPELIYRELYILCYLMKSLVFLQFWLLAGDLLDIRQAKRLFPVLLGFSLMGGLTASIAASIFPRWGVAPETLLTMAGFLLIAGLVPVQLVSQRWRRRLTVRREAPSRLTAVWSGLRGDIRIALSSGLMRTLSLCVLLLALLAQVLDFLMGKAAHATFSDLESLTAFYAILNAVVIGAGTLIQFLLANRILSSLGVTRGQLLAPVTFLAGFTATVGAWIATGGVLTGGFFVAVLASRAIQKVSRISIVRTSSDLIFNAFPRDRRGRAKAFKETVIEPSGVLLSGLLLMLGAALPLQYLLGGAALLSIVFLFVTLELKDDYLESLVHVLKERSRFRFALPSIMMRAASLKTPEADDSVLRRALDDDEASVRLLAVEVAAELKEPEAAALLVDRFREEKNSDVRAGMLTALGKMVHRKSVAPEAEGLEDLDPRVRASGMASIAESGISRIDELMEPPAPKQPSRAARPAEPEPPPVTTELTKTAKRRHFLGLARSGERNALEKLVHYLEDGDGATRHLAARALETCGEPAVDLLTLALWSTDVEGRRYVIRALGRIGTERAKKALLPILSLEAEEAYYDLQRVEAVGHLPDDPSVSLLRDSIIQRTERAKRNAHQVLRSVFMGEPGMRLILSNLNHPDRYVRSSAIEALEVRVDPSVLGGILPLFEHENTRFIAEHGGSQFELPKRSPREVLAELTRHRSPWVRACAIFVVGRAGDTEGLKPLEARLDDPYELARLNAIEAIGRLGNEESLRRLETMSSENAGTEKNYADAAIDEIRARL